MALESLCGLGNAPYMKPSPFDVGKDFLYKASSNVEDPMCLDVPPFQNPCENLTKLLADGGKDGIKIDFDHGTTTLAFKFRGGVLIAVDSRATGGQYIGSQTMKKVVEINQYMLGTLAGGAADCVYWDRVLSKECRLHELRNKERISVAAASKMMSNISYDYKGLGLSMGMMLAGYDKRGPALYYIDSDSRRISGDLFSVGSGSVYAYGILDTGYKWDLTDEEAQELGRRAIYHATFRDGASGGIIRVYQIKEDGWVNISNEDCMDLHYAYEQEKLESHKKA